MENKEKRTLPIIVLLIGILALVLSWIPIINNFAAILAVIAIILGGASIIINRKNKKTLSVVGTLISILTIVIVLTTQSMYSNAIDNAVNTSMSSAQKEDDKQFKWTKNDYDTLISGDSLTGVGGTNYDTVKDKYGRPSSSSESKIGNYTTKYISWDTVGSDNYKAVSLTFTKQSDGTWLLSNKAQSGLD